MVSRLPSQLSDAHIRAQARLRDGTTGVVERIWRSLPAYDREQVPLWLSAVVPVVLASQRTSVALTEAFLARSLRRQPIGVNPDELVGAAVRNGTDPSEVYHRPFVTVWSALGASTLYEDAIAAGLARATSTAAMDVQLSMRATANAVGEADDGIFGYTRVADGGACQFCSEIDGAFVKSADASPLHPHCGCGLEPVTSPRSRAATRPSSGVAVHEHGELGPVLGSSGHNFTGPSDL